MNWVTCGAIVLDTPAQALRIAKFEICAKQRAIAKQQPNTTTKYKMSLARTPTNHRDITHTHALAPMLVPVLVLALVPVLVLALVLGMIALVRTRHAQKPSNI